MSRRLALGLAVVVAACAADSRAIEMFTFFGDGSRIGLPSLEVPVEAYPGIPLRSDRIRARRRGSRPAPAAVRGAATPDSITLRAVPASAPRAVAPRSPARPVSTVPVAPEPPG